MNAYRLSITTLLSNHTMDRRTKTVSTDITERASNLGNMSPFEGPVSPYFFAVDGVIIKSKGKALWYASEWKE